jgi:K+/H+ antiporter YhaU regulatory subunit KhtT
VISVIHDGNAEINPGPETIINCGDVLVLLGTAEKIDRAIELCLGSPGARSDQKSSVS